MEGGENCSRRALDEEAVLRDNPDQYRLCCVTSVYGDITACLLRFLNVMSVVNRVMVWQVKVQGAVGAAQWTR